MWLFFVVACAPEAVLLQRPDPARTGLDGSDGPFGAAVVRVHTQARVVERLSYDVVFPADSAGEPHPDLTAVPVVSWIHGGLVPPDEYHWLAQHWATRGFVSVIPHHDFDLAITQPSNAALSMDHLYKRGLDTLVSDESPRGIGGHSLGGVVASIEWASNPDQEWLFLAASIPAQSTPVQERTGPVLGIVGENDGLLTPEEMQQDTQRFLDLQLAVLSGLNHYGWTQTGEGGERSNDGPLTEELDVLHHRIHRLVDTSMDAHLLGDAAAFDRLEQPVPGVQ